MKAFIQHFSIGLLLYVTVTLLTFGLGTLFSEGYDALSFFLLVGLPGAYGFFIYLTSYFNLTISIIQFVLTGFLSFAAIGMTEPLYHDFLYYNNFGKVVEITVSTTIGLSILVTIKLLFDKGLKGLKFKTQEQKIKKYCHKINVSWLTRHNNI